MLDDNSDTKPLRTHTWWVAITVFVIGLGLIYVKEAAALAFTNGINESSWRFEGSKFECKLMHDIPFYGEAEFRTRAGEKASFALNAQASRLKTGKAALQLIPPKWRHNLNPVDMGYVAVKQGNRPVKLGDKYAERILTELYTGYELMVTRRPWYDGEYSTDVLVSPIGFRDVYQRYLGCLGDLLPVNFDQIKRTAIYFGSGKYEPLPSDQKRKLDHIVAYFKADSSITEFFIDGHTDSVGTRADNFILAENRANEVAAYLTENGLPEDRIVVRWHGERYPAQSNATIQGRAENRRVTIRLERDPMLAPQGS